MLSLNFNTSSVNSNKINSSKLQNVSQSNKSNPILQPLTKDTVSFSGSLKPRSYKLDNMIEDFFSFDKTKLGYVSKYIDQFSDDEIAEFADTTFKKFAANDNEIIKGLLKNRDTNKVNHALNILVTASKKAPRGKKLLSHMLKVAEKTPEKNKDIRENILNINRAAVKMHHTDDSILSLSNPNAISFSGGLPSGYKLENLCHDFLTFNANQEAYVFKYMKLFEKDQITEFANKIFSKLKENNNERIKELLLHRASDDAQSSIVNLIEMSKSIKEAKDMLTYMHKIAQDLPQTSKSAQKNIEFLKKAVEYINKK